jgi:hypothetical protein
MNSGMAGCYEKHFGGFQELNLFESRLEFVVSVIEHNAAKYVGPGRFTRAQADYVTKRD